MDVKADGALTGLAPPDPAQPPGTADAVGGPTGVGGDGVSKSGADAAGGPAGVGGDGVAKSGADAAGGPAGVGGDGVSKSGADAAGGPAGVGGDGVSKSGADAVVLDLGKVLPVPLEEQKKEGDLDAAAAARAQGACPSVVVDIIKSTEYVKGADAGGCEDDGGSWKAEKECRICHVSPDRRESSDGSELIQLGCGCKNDLGTAHRHCAEAWFKLKGNRCCEICGLPAKNVTGIEDANFLEEWNEGALSNNGNGTANERGRCWRGQPLCNFLMACLVVAFILPWFFRVNMF